jgi:hypothetical protein
MLFSVNGFSPKELRDSTDRPISKHYYLGASVASLSFPVVALFGGGTVAERYPLMDHCFACAGSDASDDAPVRSTGIALISQPRSRSRAGHFQLKDILKPGSVYLSSGIRTRSARCMMSVHGPKADMLETSSKRRE